ncbi:MAG TPA: hypothetical protein VN641_14365 [Urbifossiella sp.]|jgi:hypothetical protein|nr:hypothetical protein [Urbifossiella sp.]
MAVPTGEIVARPMVARACGCMCEFQHYAVDKYRAQRLTKFQKTRCAECVAKLNEEHRQAAAEIPKKGEAIQMLPIGTQIAISRKPDGTWSGKLSAGAKTVEADGAGPQGLTIALARLWLSANGMKASPQPATPQAAKPPMQTAPRPKH